MKKKGMYGGKGPKGAGDSVSKGFGFNNPPGPRGSGQGELQGNADGAFAKSKLVAVNSLPTGK